MHQSQAPKWIWGALLAAFLSCSATVVYPQALRQYTARNWQTDEGLPHNSVFSIQQTRDGYLWIATQQGLARFDGVRFQVYQNAPALKEPAIHALCESSDGALWIGFDRRGLSRYRDGVFEPGPLSFNGLVRLFLQTRDGSLWIGTPAGLSRWKDGRAAIFTRNEGLPSSNTLALAEDPDGNLWIGTSRGLAFFSDGALRPPPSPSLFTAELVRALLWDREKNLWIGLGGGGLARLKDGQITLFGKSDGVSDGFITSIFQDRFGELWVGTMSGLCRRSGDKFVTELTRDGGSYGTIFCFANDREGGLWLGSKEGLTQLQPKLFQTFTRQEGLAHNNVMAVCEDREGTVWMATWGGGMSKLKGNEIVNYNAANSRIYELFLSICQTRDQNLWFGADFDGGLFRYGNGAFTRFGANEGLTNYSVRVIYQDRADNLWIGTGDGLYRCQEGKLERLGESSGIGSEVVRVLFEDRQGTLWTGTNKGLKRRVDGRFSEVSLPYGPWTGAVVSLYEDQAGNLWIGSDGQGLHRFKDGKLTSYTTREGLFSDGIFEILEDNRNNLWMSCLSGIFHVKKSELDDLDRRKILRLSCVVYGKADGMASVQCNGVSKPSGWKGRDGRLWFPTTRGVAVIDPQANLKESGPPPPVQIEEVIADKARFDGPWLIAAGSKEPHVLKLKPGSGELEIHYTALSLARPEKNRFQYRLTGVDSDWVDAGTRRVAYYNNIAPGHYRFDVIACNSDGVWNDGGASLGFVLQPHFWQTRWCKALIGFLAVGLIVAVARYATWRKVQQRLVLLEQQHAIQRERSRIAQDMHDDLGARLTQILLLNEVALKCKNGEAAIKEQVSKVSQVTQDLARNLDGIVWAINPQNDSLDKLSLYLYEYIEMFFGHGSIRYRLDVPQQLPPWPLSSEVRHNIFLVLKEALNNIVKHAEASEVWFRLRAEDLKLSIAIEDNGRGLRESASSAFGSGLINMKKRVEKIHGRFELHSQPGKGTSIRLEIPLPHPPARTSDAN